MKYLKSYRQIILFILLYASLLLLGFEIYEIANTDNLQGILDYSGLIAKALLSVGLFWELYLSPKFQKNKN